MPFSEADGTLLVGWPLVDRIAQEIQTRIMSGVLPIGTRLRQEALAQEFGVSRTPIREALRQLQSTRMIDLQPRRGAVIRGPSPREIREAYLVRAELEGLAAELAAELITDEQITLLAEAAARFRTVVEHFVSRAQPGSSEDSHGWLAANDLFHTVILEAADNNRLYETVLHLHRGLPRNLTWAALRQNARLLSQNVDQHDAILNAICAREPTLARTAMREHIANSRELVARHYERVNAIDVPKIGLGPNVRSASY